MSATQVHGYSSTTYTPQDGDVVENISDKKSYIYNSKEGKFIPYVESVNLDSVIFKANRGIISPKSFLIGGDFTDLVPGTAYNINNDT
jgi:hypothetical protein